MPTPFPPQVEAAVRTTVERLNGVAAEHSQALVDLSQGLIEQLSARMRALAGSGRSFERTAAASKIVQLQAVVERLGAKYGTAMGAAAQKIGSKAAGIGRSQLRKELAAWGAALPGSEARFVAPDLASALLDPGLLEHYKASRRAYGMEAIGKMRIDLAAGALQGESLEQTWKRMAANLALPEWRAERIVRTEQSLAVHRRQLLDMEEMYGRKDRSGKVVVDGWWKELVATFDRRTGDDSRFVHGQRRRLHEYFEDNEGRRYMTPPNRPNDREKVIFVPDEAA